MLISLNTLRPADIIVTTTNLAVSAVIRAGTGSSVSHSMLYIGGSLVVEAVGSGVTRRPITDAFDHEVLAIALRRRNLTAKQRSDVVEYATRFAAQNLPYDKVGAAGSGTTTGRGVCWAGSVAPSVCCCARPERLKYRTTQHPRTRTRRSSVRSWSRDASSWLGRL